MADNPRWQELLDKAVNEPGTIHKAYSQFWEYSAGNQMLAYAQCLGRHITPGPISTYPGWIAKGRHVKRGEKAITLCMPVTFKAQGKDAEGDAEEKVVTGFVYRPHWFVLAQTDGDAYTPPPPPEWDKGRALAALDIAEVEFASTDGNCQGYAREGTVAVSPLAFNAYKTLIHECAHVLMHQGDHQDGTQTPRDLKEVEAECVALLVSEALDLGNQAECRGYIQHWMRQGGKDAIPEKSAQRIFANADKILKAGRQVRQ